MAGLEYVAAVPLSVAAAACFGTAGFLQHQAARSVPETGPLQPRLALSLLRIGAFRWSLGLSVVAFAMQAAALALAPLAVVQPLLVTGVLFYLLAARLRLRHAPDRLLLLGAIVALVGLAGFQLVARPLPGHGDISGAAALPLGLTLVGIVVVALVGARHLPGEYRVLPLAAATAVCYGVTATLLRSLLVSNPESLLWQWPLYAVLVVAPAGFLLNQSAFQEGAVGSVAVTVITVGDPVVSIVAGTLWLGETLARGGARTVVEMVSLVVMAVGIGLLANRAQQVAASLRRSDPTATARSGS